VGEKICGKNIEIFWDVQKTFLNIEKNNFTWEGIFRNIVFLWEHGTPKKYVEKILRFSRVHSELSHK